MLSDCADGYIRQMMYVLRRCIGRCLTFAAQPGSKVRVFYFTLSQIYTEYLSDKSFDVICSNVNNCTRRDRLWA